ncbi:hypothetical protein B0J14DRAFT_700576 [Halenospora varia]|nr:hypothetical protein B0J14DRAFT_700576 [Halenospora varia]
MHVPAAATDAGDGNERPSTGFKIDSDGVLPCAEAVLETLHEGISEVGIKEIEERRKVVREQDGTFSIILSFKHLAGVSAKGDDQNATMTTDTANVDQVDGNAQRIQDLARLDTNIDLILEDAGPNLDPYYTTYQQITEESIQLNHRNEIFDFAIMRYDEAFCGSSKFMSDENKHMTAKQIMHCRNNEDERRRRLQIAWNESNKRKHAMLRAIHNESPTLSLAAFLHTFPDATEGPAENTRREKHGWLVGTISNVFLGEYGILRVIFGGLLAGFLIYVWLYAIRDFTAWVLQSTSNID